MEHKLRGRKMFCWKCGKEIPDEALFCSYCGTEVKSTGTIKADVGPGEKRDYRAFVAIGLIILLLLAAATILIGALSNREKADTAAETPLPSEGSLTAAESPAPTETPAPTKIPEPTETPRPRFISPEQYALENGLDWPAEGSDAWGDKKDPWSEGFKTLNTITTIVRSWDDSFPSSYLTDEDYTYANLYMQARADGKSDLEAHEIGLEETGIDRRILGKEEYGQFIYDSAINIGVSEYDSEKCSNAQMFEWDTAWDAYKYARDNGSGHEQAIGSVDWKCFANVAESSNMDRYAKYLEQGMTADDSAAKVWDETDKLYELLQYWYEIKREDIEA